MAKNDKNEPKEIPAKRPRYLQSIIGIFIIPVAIFYFLVRKQMQWKPFWYAAVTIAIIGWAWSWTVTSNIWWSFGWPFMLGYDVIPHLPLEEVLFYPFGGVLTIFLYVFAAHRTRHIPQKSAAGYWAYILIGTAAFGILAYVKRFEVPFYLYSQLIVYNLVCCIILAFFIAKDMNLIGMAAPIVALGTIGYFWDHYAIGYGWWAFHAVTQVYIGRVPLDEFNFFFLAPPSAIAIYLVYCKLFKLPQIKETP